MLASSQSASSENIQELAEPPLGSFLESLQATPVSSQKGKAVWKLTVTDLHLRTYDIVHGGVIATLLDTAMGRAVSTLCRVDQCTVTAQLNVNFIRPAVVGEELFASGEVLHSGRQTAVTRGEVRTPDGTLVATASGTFMFVPRPKEVC